VLKETLERRLLQPKGSLLILIILEANKKNANPGGEVLSR
jgi:hypothetical protein